MFDARALSASGGVKPKEEDDCSEDTRQKAYKILKTLVSIQRLPFAEMFFVCFPRGFKQMEG